MAKLILALFIALPMFFAQAQDTTKARSMWKISEIDSAVANVRRHMKFSGFYANADTLSAKGDTLTWRGKSLVRSEWAAGTGYAGFVPLWNSSTSLSSSNMFYVSGNPANDLYFLGSSTTGLKKLLFLDLDSAYSSSGLGLAWESGRAMMEFTTPVKIKSSTTADLYLQPNSASQDAWIRMPDATRPIWALGRYAPSNDFSLVNYLTGSSIPLKVDTLGKTTIQELSVTDTARMSKGIKFPDGSFQVSAASGGSGAAGYIPYWSSASVSGLSNLAYAGNDVTSHLFFMGNSSMGLKKLYFLDLSNLTINPPGLGLHYYGAIPLMGFSTGLMIKDTSDVNVFMQPDVRGKYAMIFMPDSTRPVWAFGRRPTTNEWWLYNYLAGGNAIQVDTLNTVTIPKRLNAQDSIVAQKGIIFGDGTTQTTAGGGGGSIPDSQKVYASITNQYMMVGSGDTSFVPKRLKMGSPYLTSTQDDTTITIGLTADADSAIARAIRFLTATGVNTGVGSPAAVILVSPANIATGQSIIPTLVWRKTSDMTRYWVQLSDVPYIGGPIVDDSTKVTANDTTRAATGLGNSMTYYWRVKAKNINGWGDWSSIYSFSTVAAGGTPIAENVKGSNSQASGTSLAVTVSVNSNAYTYCVVAIGGAGYATASAVSDGTNSFTRIVTRAVAYPSAELWGYKYGNTSGSKTITATFAQSTAAAMQVIVFSNVNQSTPIGSPVAANGTGTSPTVSLSSGTGEVVVDCLSNDYATVTPQGTYTLIGGIDVSGGEVCTSVYRPGGSTVNANYSLSQSMEWDLVAIALKPL